MEINEKILQSAFDAVSEYILEPLKPHEFTASMMAKKFPHFQRRHWMTILDQGVREGRLQTRFIKGGGRAYWEPQKTSAPKD